MNGITLKMTLKMPAQNGAGMLIIVDDRFLYNRNTLFNFGNEDYKK